MSIDRKIKVYSTRGQSGIEIETNVTTLGELSGVLNAHDYELDLSRMKAVVGQTKATLESNDSVLPEGDFTLFLMPTKTKSGVVDSSTAPFREIRAEIKDIITSDASAYLHFNSGKNYTNKGSEVLRTLLQSWYDRIDTTYDISVHADVVDVIDVVDTLEMNDLEKLQVATNVLEKLEDDALRSTLNELCILDDLELMISDYMRSIKCRLSAEELLKLSEESHALSKIIPGLDLYDYNY